MADDRPRVTRRRKQRRTTEEAVAEAAEEQAKTRDVAPDRPRRERGRRPQGPPKHLLDRNELEQLANMDASDFAAALASSSRPGRRRLDEGDRLDGTVVGTSGQQVFVDIGERAEALLDAAELGHRPEAGEPITAWVAGHRGGAVRLTLRPPITAEDPEERRRQAIERREAEKLQALRALTVGQIVVGKVAALQDFGAFVEIGQASGLVRLPNLSRERVKHPSDILKVGDEVRVRVLGIDLERKRLDLGIRQLEDPPPASASAGGRGGGLGTLGDLFAKIDLG